MAFEVDRFVKEWVYRIEPYIPGEMKKDYIKLASNENNYGPSPKVAETIKKYIKSINVYPYKDMEVKEAIAEYCNVKKENIIVGSGSDELIDIILKVFKSPVIFFNPTFIEYKICSQILGEKYFYVNLNDDFSFPKESFINNASNANIIFLCSPNNPTGSIISLDDIEDILELGKITIVDEAYFEFYGRTSCSLLDDYKNLIILRTFSKAFALGGLRIGYGIADSEIIDLLMKVKQPFNVSSIAQVAAIAALSDIKFMKRNVNSIIKDRDILYKKLSEKFRAFKSYANFILIDSSPMKSEDFFSRLYENRIIVRRIGKISGFDGDYIRITVGTSNENRKLLNVIDNLDNL